MWAIDSHAKKLKTARVARGSKKTKKNAKSHGAEDKQVVFLRKTAQDIIDSGLLGKGEFMISLSGHANENFVSLHGTQNDMMMLSVQKLAEKE